MSEVPPPSTLLGVPIHPVVPQQLVELLVRWGSEDAVRRIYNVNVHAMNLAHDDAELRQALVRADIVFCDGFGVKWGARLAGITLPARMSPPDWIDDFAVAATHAGQSIYALGDEPGVAAQFQHALARRHAGYLDAGSHHGFFAKTGPENDAVIEQINASGATHLLVGFGMPLQEKWIDANAHRLRVRTITTVGAMFRWIAGVEQRAPRWVTDNGLEWLHRFVQHPVRHFRRYAIGNPRFLWRLVCARRAG